MNVSERGTVLSSYEKQRPITPVSELFNNNGSVLSSTMDLYSVDLGMTEGTPPQEVQEPILYD
jgi:hypothetical protein